MYIKTVPFYFAQGVEKETMLRTDVGDSQLFQEAVMEGAESYGDSLLGEQREYFELRLRKHRENTLPMQVKK